MVDIENLYGREFCFAENCKLNNNKSNLNNTNSWQRCDLRYGREAYSCYALRHLKSYCALEVTSDRQWLV